MVNINFEVDATNLNLADTAGYSLYSFSDSDNRFRIPIRLELSKDAGTAYTLTAAQYPQRRVEWYQSSLDNYAELFQGGQYLIIESKDSRGVSQPLFAIPLAGFLDSAAQEKRLAFPLRNGDTYRLGATSLNLRTTVNVEGGTGSLRGRLFIDEYTVGGF